MAIPVTCTCGKSFHAKPELAGKRVKCPACGSPLHIPQATLTPVDDDPLGLGGFDERNFGPAFNAPMAPSPFGTTSAYSTLKPQTAKKSNLPIVLAIVGGVCAVGFVVIVLLIALLLPAIQAARQAAQRVQLENETRAAGVGRHENGGPAVQAAAGWRDYAAPSGAYIVKLPGTPKLQNQTQPSPNGLVTISMAVVDLGDVGAYFVAFNELPAQHLTRADLRRVLDGSVNGLTSSMSAQVTSSRDFDEYGGMVREVGFTGTARGMALVGSCRIILANDRLYQLMWLGPQGRRPEEDLKYLLKC